MFPLCPNVEAIHGMDSLTEEPYEARVPRTVLNPSGGRPFVWGNQVEWSETSFDVFQSYSRSREETMTTRQVLYAHGDPIRVVPLALPEELKAAAATPPQLTFNNGPLLSAVEVFTVFWGAAWQQAPQSDLANNLNQFFDFILTSPLIDQLSEYDIQDGQSINHGKRVGTTTITSPHLRNSVSDTAIQHM